MTDVTAYEWLSFSLGLAIVVGTSISVIKTLVVPRRAWSFLPRVVDSVVTRVFMTIARRMRSYDLIDRFLGFLGPVALILTLLTWLGMFVVGFALMLHPPADDFAAAMLRYAELAKTNPDELRKLDNLLVKHLDEVQAARKPNLRWVPE